MSTSFFFQFLTLIHNYFPVHADLFILIIHTFFSLHNWGAPNLFSYYFELSFSYFFLI